MYKVIAKKKLPKIDLVKQYTSGDIPLGSYSSTLELYDMNTDRYGIEWDIPDLEVTEYIGIWTYPGTKVIADYDGVFELPLEAIELLEENGFDCSVVTE